MMFVMLARSIHSLFVLHLHIEVRGEFFLFIRHSYHLRTSVHQSEADLVPDHVPGIVLVPGNVPNLALPDVHVLGLAAESVLLLPVSNVLFLLEGVPLNPRDAIP